MRGIVLFLVFAMGCLEPTGLDSDGDGVPDSSDPCPMDAPDDDDFDGVCNSEDRCADFDDTLDTDSDGFPDACDTCAGFSDAEDADGDGVADGCDVCDDGDDNEDADGDGVANRCDPCPGDFPDDTDGDGVCDSDDRCPEGDDTADADGDGIPDGCDACEGSPDGDDEDSDGVPDVCDSCPGEDDRLDLDQDGVADGCDQCPGFDDTADADGDLIPDGCDTCEGGTGDVDNDGVVDACDRCPGFDDGLDDDSDGVPDGCDRCPQGDDRADEDLDGAPDACDACPGFDDRADPDGDGIPTDCDECPEVVGGRQVLVLDPSFQSGDGWEWAAGSLVDPNEMGIDPGVGIASPLSRGGFFTNQCMPSEAEAGPLKFAISARHVTNPFWESPVRIWIGQTVETEFAISTTFARGSACLGPASYDTELRVGAEVLLSDVDIYFDLGDIEPAAGECPSAGRMLSQETGAMRDDRGIARPLGWVNRGEVRRTMASVPLEGASVHFEGRGRAHFEVDGVQWQMEAGQSMCLPRSTRGRTVVVTVRAPDSDARIDALSLDPCLVP